ncbi:MAG: hypothetical protein RL338_1280 [Chloroflexota bacterium]
MDRSPVALACPKCGGPMSPRERQGVVIDVCGECRGVFLDRGELDRLLDLESAAAVPPAAGRRDAAAYPGRDDARGYRRDDDDDDDDRPWGRDRDQLRTDGRGYPKKRRGFLGELFEGFGD